MLQKILSGVGVERERVGICFFARDHPVQLNGSTSNVWDSCSVQLFPGSARTVMVGAFKTETLYHCPLQFYHCPLQYLHVYSFSSICDYCCSFVL